MHFTIDSPQPGPARYHGPLDVGSPDGARGSSRRDGLEATYRTNAGRLDAELGQGWRQQVIDVMRACRSTSSEGVGAIEAHDLGIGPLSRRHDGRQFSGLAEAHRLVVTDLRSIDERVLSVHFWLPSHNWVAGAALPLDNPEVISRAVLWSNDYHGPRRPDHGRPPLPDPGQGNSPPGLGL